MENKSLARQEREARAELERAFSLHLQGNKADALKALRKAIGLFPALAKETYTSNLAKEITGLPVNEALRNLVDADAGKKLIDTAKQEQRSTPAMRRQHNLLPVLGVLVVVLVGLVAWTITSGGFDSYFTAMRLEQLKNQKFNVGGYDYYVAVPKGSTPEGGWPMVVVFHGYGGDGRQMLPLAEIFNTAGAILVAPTLGEYQPNPGKGPLEPVVQMLTEVGKQYPLQARGAILLGFSQGGSFAYRFSVYYPNQSAGVVTAGAPEFDAIYPSRNIPYIFTWGEKDELQQFVMPMVYPIINRGFNVQTAIVPGAGHEMTQYAVDQALMLLGKP